MGDKYNRFNRICKLQKSTYRKEGIANLIWFSVPHSNQHDISTPLPILDTTTKHHCICRYGRACRFRTPAPRGLLRPGPASRVILAESGGRGWGHRRQAVPLRQQLRAAVVHPLAAAPAGLPGQETSGREGQKVRSREESPAAELGAEHRWVPPLLIGLIHLMRVRSSHPRFTPPAPPPPPPSWSCGGCTV